MREVLDAAPLLTGQVVQASRLVVIRYIAEGIRGK